MKSVMGYLTRSVSLFMIGLLLIINPDTPILIVRVLAALFLFFGLLSLLHYLRARFFKIDVARPLFPVTGIGSVAIGLLLGFYPEQFIQFLMYLLGAAIILFGASQTIAIIRYRRVAPMRWWAFVLPLGVLAAGLFLLFRPLESASMPFIVIGYCCIANGISELFYGLRLSAHMRRQAKEEAIQEAEIIEEMPAAEIHAEETTANTLNE